MIFDLVIKNGNTYVDSEIKKLNVGVIDSNVVSLFDSDNYEARSIIDAENQFVLPGFIDVHFHVRSPSYPERGTVETETRAAAAGGITAIFEMPIAKPCCSTLNIFAERKEHFTGRSFTNFGIYAAPGTKFKDGERPFSEVYEEDRDKILGFRDAGAIAFKIFMIEAPLGREDEFDGLSIVDRGHLFHTLKLIKSTDLVSTIHAECNDLLKYYQQILPEDELNKPESHNLLRPPDVESTAINEILYLNKFVDTKIHIAHLSSNEGLKVIRHYQSENCNVSTETCPHYLFYDDSAIKEFGNFAKINPPIRTSTDQDALWSGLKDDVISIIASDHAAFCSYEKLATTRIDKVPPGHPGVNSLVYTMVDKVSKGEFTIQDIVKFYSSNPAERFGINHLMGSISPGLSANITILDMNKTHYYNSDQQFSHAKSSDVLYSGKKFNGKIEKTIVNGKVVYDGQTVLTEQVGRFINPNNKVL